MMSRDQWAVLIGMALCLYTGIWAWNHEAYIRLAVSMIIFYWGMCIFNDLEDN